MTTIICNAISLTVLCEMTVTIPKPLLSLEGMIVKDTELLKVRKRKQQREWPPARSSPKWARKQKIQATYWNDLFASLSLWMSQALANDQRKNKGIVASQLRCASKVPIFKENKYPPTHWPKEVAEGNQAQGIIFFFPFSFLLDTSL